MHEYNNTRMTSKPISFGVDIKGKISTPQTYIDSKGNKIITYDDDWFSFRTSTRFVIDLIDLPANYDIELYRTPYRSSKNAILISTSNNLNTTPEQIVLENYIQYDTYYIRVYSRSASDDQKCYTLKLNKF